MISQRSMHNRPAPSRAWRLSLYHQWSFAVARLHVSLPLAQPLRSLTLIRCTSAQSHRVALAYAQRGLDKEGVSSIYSPCTCRAILALDGAQTLARRHDMSNCQTAVVCTVRYRSRDDGVGRGHPERCKMEQVTASRNDLDVRFQAELAVGGGSAQQRAGRTVRLKEVTREPMRGRRKGTPPRG